MAGFDKRYMVKKWVGEIQGKLCRFRVFTTGQPPWLLFCPLDAYGCQIPGREVPLRRSDLTIEARRRLPRGT